MISNKTLHKTYILNTFIFLISTLILLFRNNQIKNNKNNSTNTNNNNNKLNTVSYAPLITFIAFIYYFLISINNYNNKPYYKNYILRYFDWLVTTPILLIDLIIILKWQNNIENIKDENLLITEIIFYNTIMLLFGVLGELGILNMYISMLLGFIPFIFIFYKIYKVYIEAYNNNSGNDFKLYLFFVILWSLYGFVHLIPYRFRNTKNLLYNIMDVIAKAGFGFYIMFLTY